jgi:hypothetical protein
LDRVDFRVMKAIVLRADLIKGRLLVYFNDGTIASRTDGMGWDSSGGRGQQQKATCIAKSAGKLGSTGDSILFSVL